MSESNPNAPQVNDGSLGWDSETVTDVSTEKLHPHEKNEEIYGDTKDLDETFVESVREKGVLEPIVATQDNEVISGHRRMEAAKEVGVPTVPVRYAEFDTDLDKREAIIEFNRQREKTPGQVVNEFEEMLAIEQERAQDRKKHQESEHQETFPDAQKSDTTGQARDKAAEKVNAGVSGRTLEKGKKVKDIATGEEDTSDDVRDAAKEQWDKLQKGETSFHRAQKTVEKAEAEEEVEKQNEPESESEETPVVTKKPAPEFLQEVDNPKLVVADPPYSTDVDDITGFAKSWVPDALDAIGDDGVAFITIGAYAEELQAYLNVLGVEDALDRTQILVWTYRNTLGQTPNEKYKLNWQAVLFIQSDPATELDSPKTSEQWAVQDINAPDGRFGEGRYHQWQKPTELISRFIRHTTDEGDLVVDPFVGTGTTVLEAARLGRVAKGCDIDDEMLDVAVERGCVLE